LLEPAQDSPVADHGSAAAAFTVAVLVEAVSTAEVLAEAAFMAEEVTARPE
jgi:hypothetical protein